MNEEGHLGESVEPTRSIDQPDLVDETSAAWLESVRLKGSDKDVRVVFVERLGTTVVVRQVDPGEPDPPRIPLREGDQLELMTALSHIGHHTTSEVGNVRDLIFGQRIVPVRREPGRVIARTLRRGEPDTGERVHVRPGESVVFEEGGLTVELDYLDDQEPSSESGYVPLSPSLWTWFGIGQDNNPARTRYVLSAARRLDAASALLASIERRRQALLDEEAQGPELRRNSFLLIGEVELAIVGLGRAVDMVKEAAANLGCQVPVPPQVAASQPAVHAIRNAYEHIEDRALGRVNQLEHPDALSIFNWERLVMDDVIAYGDHELDLTTEVPAVVTEVRQFLKDASQN